MKPPYSSLRSVVGLLFASSASAQVLAQGVTSQLGGFSESHVDAVAEQPSALSLFLQQDPLMPVGMLPGVMPTGMMPTSGAVPVLAPMTMANGAMANAATVVPVPQDWGTPPVLAASPAAAPIVVQPAQPPAPQTSGFLSRPRGLMTVHAMRVASPGPEGSKISFGANSEFSMGTDSAGNFVLQESSALAPLVSVDSANTLRLGSNRVEAQSLDTQSGISVRGVQQWQLIHSEDFSAPAAGWSRNEVSHCAGISMLGGFCKFGRGEVNKTFAGLPMHSQLRVAATYHFIDRWIGETAFMKLNIGMGGCPVAVWSEQYAQQEAKNGLSLCGDAATPEGKFAVPVDVTVAHHGDAITVSFGSTMDNNDPCDESWGVSGFEIYVRS